jgi:hypothetical protein
MKEFSMANITEQWSRDVGRPRDQTKRFWGLSEVGFGMTCLVLLAALAITASLMCPAIDWTATDFLVGP